MPKETYMWQITEAGREKRCLIKVPTLTLLNAAGTWKGELHVQQTTARKPCLMSPIPWTVTSPKPRGTAAAKGPELLSPDLILGQQLVPLQRAPPICAHICIQTQWTSAPTRSISLLLSTLCSHFSFSKSAIIMQFDIRGFLIWSNKGHSWKKRRNMEGAGHTISFYQRTTDKAVECWTISTCTAWDKPTAYMTSHQGNLQGVGSSQPPGREIWNNRSWEVGQRLYICCTSNNTSKNLPKSVL